MIEGITEIDERVRISPIKTDYSNITIDLNRFGFDVNNLSLTLINGEQRATYKLNLAKMIEARIIIVEESKAGF